MNNKECNNGFHGSISEALSFDGCPECGRNYDNEDFLKACEGFNIHPDDALKMSSNDILKLASKKNET